VSAGVAVRQQILLFTSIAMLAGVRRSTARACLAVPLRTSSPAMALPLAAPVRRSIHSHSLLQNTINQFGAARVAGPQRTKKYISKRMQDKANEETAAAAAETHPFSSAAEFYSKLDSVYSRLYTSMKDMLAANPDMRFTQSSDGRNLEIALGKDQGAFTFSPEVDTQRFILFSPVSASAYKYHYDSKEDRWIADSDGHQFEELFVREIMRGDLKGFPQL
jgi:frataxin-like iron-binding protein CyaY